MPNGFNFFGEEFLPTPSGGLFWARRHTLLVADLHLEKLSSFAPKGQLLPPYDTGLTLDRLEQDLSQTGATRVLALGDSFHRDDSSSRISSNDRTRIETLARQVEMVWLSGNHDPAPHDLGGRCASNLSEEGLSFVHEPDHRRQGLVCGHLHPAARLRFNGRSVRRPCFVFDKRMLMLPAYGVATGALNIKSPAFSGLFDWQQLNVFMLGRDRVYPVGPGQLIGG